MRRRRVVILGGAGFLGSHLSERLLDMGHEVVVLDNFQTGCRDNVEHLYARDGFALIEHDVTTPFHLPADAIYNLACPASPVHYQATPIKTTLTCVLGTLHALELARVQRARVMLASTSEIYGDPDVHPQPESYHGNVNPIGIRACYDEGKRCAETLAMDYHRTHNVDVRIARIFNTYGPKMAQDDGRVVSNFIVQALRGEDLTVYGDGSQTRSFCYVDDMIDGFIALMEHPEPMGPVNLGNPGEFTVRELASIIIELTGSESHLRCQPLPADDPKLRKPNIERARAELSFSPKVDLRIGLAATIEHFREILRKDASQPRLRSSARRRVTGIMRPVPARASESSGA